MNTLEIIDGLREAFVADDQEKFAAYKRLLDDEISEAATTLRNRSVVRFAQLAAIASPEGEPHP